MASALAGSPKISLCFSSAMCSVPDDVHEVLSVRPIKWGCAKKMFVHCSGVSGTDS